MNIVKILVEGIPLAAIFTLEGLFPLQKRDSRLAHAAPNLAFGILNAACVSLIFSGATLALIQRADAGGWGVLRWIALPGWIEGALAFLLFDLWMYGWHVANHRLPLFWRFHRMHHSDSAMDCTSAVRFHTGEIVFSSIARLAVLPLLGISASQLFLYEICLQPVILFHHSNVALPEPTDRILRAILVTPNMHRVHHSQVVSETNSNYSSIFSFWDRAGGTFVKREDPEKIRFGLPEWSASERQGFRGMWKTTWIGTTT